MKSEEEILKAIGNKLKQIRIEKGYSSYEAFAIEHGISRMQYWKLEKGETNLTMRTLIRILDIHKMDLNEFFSEEFSG